MRTFQTKLTSKGQLTLPVEIRKSLGVGPGDRIEFFLHRSGEVFVHGRNKRLGDLRQRCSLCAAGHPRAVRASRRRSHFPRGKPTTQRASHKRSRTGSLGSTPTFSSGRLSSMMHNKPIVPLAFYRGMTNPIRCSSIQSLLRNSSGFSGQSIEYRVTSSSISCGPWSKAPPMSSASARRCCALFEIMKAEWEILPID